MIPTVSPCVAGFSGTAGWNPSRRQPFSQNGCCGPGTFETTRLNARTLPIARGSRLDTSGGAQPEAPTSIAPARTVAESLSVAIVAWIAAIRAAGVALGDGQVDEHRRHAVA